MRVRVRLLSGFQLRVDDSSDITPRWNKARALIAMLVLEPSGQLERRVVAERLWSPPSDPLVNLRQLLSSLKSHFSNVGIELLNATRTHISINTDLFSVDIKEIEELASSTNPAGIRSELSALECGDILGGIGAAEPTLEEWLEDHRAELRRRAFLATELIMSEGFDVGDFERARAAANLLLQIEPATEQAYRVLMRISGARGDKGAALAHFEACQNAMERLVDADADIETIELMAAIRDGDFPTIPQEHSHLFEQGLAKLREPDSLKDNCGDRLALLRVRFQCSDIASGVDQSVSAFMRDSIVESLSSIDWLFRVIDDPDGTMGADYNLGGFVRSDAHAARVSLRLTDLTTHTLLWAGHFDLMYDKTFKDADAIAGEVASAMERELMVNEATEAWSKMPEQMGWRNCMMQAIPLIFRLTPASLKEAEILLESVAEAAPANATPIAWLAFVGFLKLGQGAVGDPVAAKEELSWQIRRGIELQPDNVLMNAVAGHVASYIEHRYGLALHYFERARQINSHSAYPWAFSALTHSYIGNMDEAISRLDMFMKLWPKDPYPHFFNTARCIAHAMAGDHRETVSLAKQTLACNPNFNATYRPLISSLGHLGEIEEAERYLGVLKKREPHFSIEWFQENYPPLNSEAHTHYVAGFKKAGVPTN